MPVMNVIQAVNDALRLEMRRDPDVVVLGEDVGGFGGVFRATQGLQKEFGAERVIDTPLAEGGIVGTAVGMALYGLRPVPEIQFADFIFPAFDQIVSEVAKYRYRSGGQFSCPMVIRTPYGGGIKGGHYHSQSPEAHFLHTPGLKVVVPANPHDAKGLLLSAIRDPDPVLFFEPKRVYRAAKGEVPEGDYVVPIGKAAVTREGSQVTVIAWGAMWHEADRAAREAEAEGIDCEVLDLRSLQPLDLDAIVASVDKTGRAVVVHEAPRTCGFGAELVALVQERCFLHLEAPIARVTGFDTPVPVHARERVPAARAAHPEGDPRGGRVLRAEEATMPFQLELPDIGEGVVEAEVQRWFVAPGDEVAEDQPLVEVMTDKATVVIPSPRRGRVIRLLWKVGEIAKVHAPLVELEPSGADALAEAPASAGRRVRRAASDSPPSAPSAGRQGARDPRRPRDGA